jgi:hypothetical protein
MEGIDDLDKSASVAGNATPRRSTSSLDATISTIMNSKSLLLAALILTSCSLEHEVSNVVLPGSSISVSVIEDEKSLYHYCIHENDKPCSDGRIFGVRAGQRPRGAQLPTAVVTKSGDVATIAWPGTDLHVLIDVVRGRAIGDSNGMPLPPLKSG